MSSVFEDEDIPFSEEEEEEEEGEEMSDEEEGYIKMNVYSEEEEDSEEEGGEEEEGRNTSEYLSKSKKLSSSKKTQRSRYKNTLASAKKTPRGRSRMASAKKEDYSRSQNISISPSRRKSRSKKLTDRYFSILIEDNTKRIIEYLAAAIKGDETGKTKAQQDLNDRMVAWGVIAKNKLFNEKLDMRGWESAFQHHIDLVLEYINIRIAYRKSLSLRKTEETRKEADFQKNLGQLKFSDLVANRIAIVKFWSTTLGSLEIDMLKKMEERWEEYVKTLIQTIDMLMTWGLVYITGEHLEFIKIKFGDSELTKSAIVKGRKFMRIIDKNVK